MLSNYFKVAFRALLRHKLTSFINIAGLALGMTCCLLIFAFVQDEISYDKYHSKSDRIYRVTRSFHSPEGEVNLHLANVAPPIGPLLKNDFGEIESLARTINFAIVIGLEENGEVKITNNEPNLFVAEPAIFEIFDIDIIEGSSTSLARPFTVMLSERAALRYFNSTQINGKRLRANNQFDLEITGVYKDFPKQSHWHPEFLVAFSTLENDEVYGRTGLETNWGNNSFGTYLLLSEGVDPSKIEGGFPAFLDKHFGNYARAKWGVPADWVASKSTTLFLQRVTDVHLHSHLDDEIEVNGNINNVYMMSVIGLFIILIACFNFINLSTARAAKRSKEVGMRKVAGAMKVQLIMQYLSESVLIAFLSLLLALAISAVGVEWLNGLTGKTISLGDYFNARIIAGLVAFTLFTGFVAGIYPAFIMSSFKPVASLKNQKTGSVGGITLRRGLVVAQFAISIILMIATLLIFQQLDYLNARSLGYTRDQIITLPNYPELSNSYDAFYNEVTKSSYISNIARSSRVPTGRLLDSYGSARVMQGDSLTDATVSLKTIAVDDSFFDTYAIGMAAGRNFSRSIPTDDSLAFIINETAAQELGWTNFDQHINEDFEYAGVRGKLIGVVSDFHFESLHQRIVPMVFIPERRFNVLSIKIAGGETKEALSFLQSRWTEFLPGRPFDFQFLSANYEALYLSENRQAKLFTIFSMLAIFIASLGLFGLTTFNVLQRVKEIGIRKVLGASIPQILTLLSKETILLILLSNAIAWPVAWYFMSEWLSTFAYHIRMNVTIYIVSALAAIVLAIITVGTQSLKAALSNPAETLKQD